MQLLEYYLLTPRRPFIDRRQRSVTPRTHTLVATAQSRDITLPPFFLPPTLSLNQFYVSYNTAGAARSSVSTKLPYYYFLGNPIIVSQYSLLATMPNLKNNPIPTLDLRRQLTPGEFRLISPSPNLREASSLEITITLQGRY